MTDSDRPPPRQYRLSGLTVRSDFELPMRTSRPSDDLRPPDVLFELGEAPESLPHFSHRGPNWTANQRSFLLDLPGIGRFLSEDGCRLMLRPAPGAFLDDIAVFATGTAMAAILYQRGAMLLHASAVVHDGRAFLFCGASGSGKSTIAGALVQAGATFLADDVCSIDQSAGRPPVVLTDGRCLRLYPDSIDQVGLRDGVGDRVRRRIDKFHVTPAATSHAVQEYAPLGGIYILSNSTAAAPPGVRPMPLLEAAQSLLHHTYRRRLALAYGREGQVARDAARLLSQVPVFHLRRPLDFDRLDESVAMIRRHWASRG
ncbi:hypothetical protein [Rhizorhabdus sp. FW153]|uniref:hypothetical protein n=1 Tax=Rhizorhabdus sp. FW153 TaxID=3400216 RepID=UPI003CF63080